MRLVNLTPHKIHLHVDGQIITLPPARSPAMCYVSQQKTDVIEVDGAPVPVYATGNTVINLPPPSPDTQYVVSLPVAQLCRDRPDLLVPYRMLRNVARRVIGCQALARVQ